jgi:hypothetical protein
MTKNTPEELEKNQESPRDKYFRLKSEGLERALKKGLEKQQQKERRIQEKRIIKGRYNRSFGGRLTSFTKTSLGVLNSRNKINAIARLTYGKSIQKKPRTKLTRLPSGKYAYVPVYNNNQGYKGYGKKGRPVGTLDSRYAQYGGVYGYRKAMALKRWKERQQILENSAVSPKQQIILRQIRAREQAQRQSIESRTIPDTLGYIDIGYITKEINDATNIFK